MNEYLLNLFQFIANLTPARFIELFWYFFIFDFLRYLAIDLIVIPVSLLKRRLRRPLYDQARRRLFSEKPLVSVIAPGKNEARHRQVALKALRLGLIHNFFRNDVRGGKASAANLALRFSRGKYIVHLDADSNLSVDAIEKLLIPFFMDSRIGATGGDIRVENIHEGLAAPLQAFEYTKTISVGRRVTSEMGILRIISGAFGAFHRDVIERLSGWDVGPGLDGDITVKVRKLGYKVIFVPEAVCFTNVPTTFRSLTMQRNRWNRSLVRFRLRKHRDVLMPDANFRFSNFFAMLDSIFFNFVLNLNWWVYLLTMLFFNDRVYWVQIVMINYLLYCCMNFVQFSINLAIAPSKQIRRRDYQLLLFLPLMPLYTGLYMRCVLTYAHLRELFWRTSYLDTWNPWKVSALARTNKM